MRQVNSLNHTRWECKYHIVFYTEVSEKSIVREDTAGVGRDIS